jgi:RNA polymerase sigma-70 factor (ECF subfamily)
VKGGLMMAIQSLRTDECVDEVIDKYSNMVYRLALANMKTKYDAEDVFQDVFLRYIQKPRTFESEEHRKAWLIRVTINRCRSLWAVWFRKLKSFSEAMVFETNEENDLSEYLALLPQKYRSVIHLFYSEDLSVKEISGILGVKESTIRTRLTRARCILGKKLRGGSLYEQECL